MDILEKFFGGAARVRLIKLFLFNPQVHFLKEDIVTRTKVDSDKVRKELSFLLATSLVKKSVRGNKSVWTLNEKFMYLNEFKRLLLQTSVIRPQYLIKKIAKLGRVRAVILSGLFTDQWESTLDLLIVADGTKKSAVESVMSYLEAEVGKEIKYAVLESDDFKYRLGVGDRLIRDVIDYPHEVVLDKMAAF